jgi:hypothetical protein
MQTAAIQTLSVAPPSVGTLLLMPWPDTHDADAIFRGRTRAREMYRAARTQAEHGRALRFINHWRVLDGHAQVLRTLGLLG